jgi:outer membrane murein-binding lipoprotein Lpp
VTRRQQIGSIDSRIEELKAQQAEIDQRANETRENLQAIRKDAAAGALRAKLSRRLEQFASDGDRVGREVVELQTKRMAIRIELEDLLQNLDFSAPPVKK